jgi:hypothetical protein
VQEMMDRVETVIDPEIGLVFPRRTLANGNNKSLWMGRNLLDSVRSER